MSTSKRPRACDACHSIKIKCELGTTGGTGPCQRCIRLGKDCVVTPPKTQKDRVAELEAQVASLTRLLQSQNIDTPSLDGLTPISNSSLSVDGNLPQAEAENGLPQKKRRREQDELSNGATSSGCRFSLTELDMLIVQDLQESLVEKYRHDLVRLVPIVPIAEDWTYQRLRTEKPVLLQTIVYAASSGSVSEEVNEHLGRIVLETLTALGGQKSEASMELVQALLVAVLWYRSPKNRRAIATFQFAQKAVDIAQSIDLWQPGTKSWTNAAADSESSKLVEAVRTGLGCHLISSSIVLLMRQSRLKSLPELDSWSIHMLEYVECALETDRILCHHVRAEHLCERIIRELHLLDPSSVGNVSDPATRITMQALSNSITDFTTQIPANANCEVLAFYEHLATIHLHEILLHTSTNRHSFTAPYLAERLSITDFPAPPVTPEHVTSMYALKTACHALLDSFFTLDLQTWISLPFLLSIGRVAYTQYILVKLYIATSALNNSFGAFLDPESLQVEEYLQKLIDVATEATQIDSSTPAARILLAPKRMLEWYRKYKASLAVDYFALSEPDYSMPVDSAIMSNDGSLSLTDVADGSNSFDLDLQDLFPNIDTTNLFMNTVHDEYTSLAHVQTG
ncbi:hypothetical protein BDY17DRAFT_322880 [Neohortaea acidophila]|uniref:Zn(2)-C6 fungal-type domain-containing protein n=1 Tax=Neohortaea acidophila TaxID=245834 RepID=A0A6A6PW86_9PEZI|nr:uncharacterized protein BDY17DRAFT_322880 [Neohortaea acidophila]KAF2483994.1 hypothetical protein BDY17DRAFT_322880 [Neohortaea acidophila]